MRPPRHRLAALLLALLAPSPAAPRAPAPRPAAPSPLLVANRVLGWATPSPPYDLAMCAMVHNEAKYILEWVLYHYALGFQHFYVYDNESTDSTLRVLAPLVARRLVTVLPWAARDGVKTPQGQQINHCFGRAWGDGNHSTAWMANLDIDEFLVVAPQRLSNHPAVQPGKQFVLRALLGRWKGWGKGAVVMDRMEFGPSGHRTPPKDLVIASYTGRQVQPVAGLWAGKVVALLDAVEYMLGAHDAKARQGWETVTADLEPYNSSATRGHRYFSSLRVNHYVTRSHQECLAKLHLGRWPAAMDWRRSNGKAVCDRMMEGSPEFDPIANAEDWTLAAGPWPAVVRHMVAALLAPAAAASAAAAAAADAPG